MIIRRQHIYLVSGVILTVLIIQFFRVSSFRKCPDVAQTDERLIYEIPPTRPCPIIPVNENNDSPWLVIGIPTVPRPKKVEYLGRTLETIISQLPRDASDPMFGKILVYILSHDREDEHKSFTEAKKKYENNNALQFVHMKSTFDLPLSNLQKVPEKVVAQTLDIVHFLRQVPRSKYLLFMEDDFEFCSNLFLSIQHLIQKCNHRFGVEGWNSIRMSYGLNGIIFPNDNDIVPSFASYLDEHSRRRPPDHLYTEFAAKETKQSKDILKERVIVGYRYNGFNHLGRVSTLREQPQWDFPGCWDELLVPTVFEVEAYNKIECPNDDITPCCKKGSWPGCDQPDLFPWIRWMPDKPPPTKAL